jgi:hypothetical protein
VIKKSNKFDCQCKHFTGVQNEFCAVGVKYDSVSSKSPPFGIPCLMKALPCLKREFLTAEEEAAKQAEMDKWLANTFQVRAEIVKRAAGKRGVSGAFECPICKVGKLRYSIAGCNGHIHARCSTDDCICFME